LGHGTKVTVAATYSSFKVPQITRIQRQGSNTTLTWTGDNGGPFTSATVGGASSGFGVQHATSLLGPWTTSYAPTNSITVADSETAVFYRIAAPVSGMTTLCATPVTLP
jgi:hypothetical protein